jgi:hypothetical protein
MKEDKTHISFFIEEETARLSLPTNPQSSLPSIAFGTRTKIFPQSLHKPTKSVRSLSASSSRINESGRNSQLEEKISMSRTSNHSTVLKSEVSGVKGIIDQSGIFAETNVSSSIERKETTPALKKSVKSRLPQKKKLTKKTGSAKSTAAPAAEKVNQSVESTPMKNNDNTSSVKKPYNPENYSSSSPIHVEDQEIKEWDVSENAMTLPVQHNRQSTLDSIESFVFTKDDLAAGTSTDELSPSDKLQKEIDLFLLKHGSVEDSPVEEASIELTELREPVEVKV